MALTEEQLLSLKEVLEDVSGEWQTLKKAVGDEEMPEEAPAEEMPAEEQTPVPAPEAPAEETPVEAPAEEMPEEGMAEMEDEGYNPAEIYAAMDEDELASHWEALKAVISEKWAAEAAQGEMPEEMPEEEAPMEAPPEMPEEPMQEKPAFKSEPKVDKEKESLKKSLKESEDSLKTLMAAFSSRLPSRKAVASTHEVPADLKKSEAPTLTVRERAKKLATSAQLSKSEQGSVVAYLSGSQSAESEVLKILTSKQA